MAEYRLIIPRDLKILLLAKKGVTVKEIIRRVYGYEDDNLPRGIYAKVSYDLFRLSSQGLVLKDYRTLPYEKGIRPLSYYTLTEEGERLLEDMKKLLEEEVVA